MKKMTPIEVAEALEEHQRWRRGEGKYDWDPQDPKSVHAPMPFNPKELGEIEDQAIKYLKSIKFGKAKKHVCSKK